MSFLSHEISKQLIVVVSATLILGGILLFATSGKRATSAQNMPTDMRARLEHLRDEMEAGDLMLGFQFVAPISSEGDNYWLFGDPNDESNLSIVEIGNDYFCFSETSRAAVLIRCVPFTNIASFDYLGT